jgi:hypothetical protein
MIERILAFSPASDIAVAYPATVVRGGHTLVLLFYLTHTV